jgi:ATP-dependent exoDNAse (exonuclease V) alpha subunit
VAIFRLQITSLARSAGRRATAAAAYRAGARISDERSGDIHDYSSRRDVMHSEVLLPTKLQAGGAQWARDRSRLWNAAEQAENRKTARVAREFQVSLPWELSAQQRLGLARAFSQELADRYGIAVDLAVHEARPGGDPRNVHAHLLATTREVTPFGLGAKAGLDMRQSERLKLGLPSSSQAFSELRARWVTLTNQALREGGRDARVDQHARAAQGTVREPRPRLPPARRSGPRRVEEIRRDAARTWLQVRPGQPDSSDQRAAAVREPAAQAKQEPTRDPPADRGADDDSLP